MIIYWLLLLVTSIVAYALGSMDTMVIASNYVFHTSLRRLGRENLWLSNFRRIYGIPGFIKLLLVEVIKDILPILFGWLMLGFKGHGDVGRIFGAFCMVLGRLYPLFYDFKGSHASVCIIMAGLFADPSVGIATAVAVAAVTLMSKYLSLGAIAGAAVMMIVSVLMVDDKLILKLMVIIGALVIVKHIPAVSRMINHKEWRISFEEDISYKLDERFR